MTAPKRQLSQSDEHPGLEVIRKALEQVRSAMDAAYALLAVRDAHDSRGLRWLARAGDVPAFGSRLQLDSEFTRECLQTGSIVLCEDSETDPRIRVGVARLLRMRSAISVPVHSCGSIVGIIQLFSPRPHNFNHDHICALQEITKLFAPILAPESRLPLESLANGFYLAAQESQSLALANEDLNLVELKETEIEPILRHPTGIPRDVIHPVSGRVHFKRSLWSIISGHAALLGSAALCAIAIFFLLANLILKTTKTVDQRAIPSRSTTTPFVTSDSPISKLPASPVVDSQAAPDRHQLSTPIQTPSILPSFQQKFIAANSLVPPARPSTTSNSLPPQDVLRSSVPFIQPPAESSDNRIKIEVNANPPPATTTNGAPASTVSSNSAPAAETETHAKFSESAIASPEAGALPTANASSALVNANSRPDFVLDRIVKGHSGWVTGLAFTADGKRLVSGSWDQTVKTWDVPTGTEVNSVGGTVKEVQALAFSRDGRWLAAENSRDNVTLWDAITGQQVRTLPTDKHLTGMGGNWVYSIAFSPDGSLLASAIDDKTVRLWDVKTGQKVRDLTTHRRPVIYAAFSPDGRWFATGDDEKSIGIWNVSTGVEVLRLTGHKKLIYAVAFSPNGKWLASASAEKTIKIWDVELGREINTLTGHNDLVTSLAFSPDGRWLASGSWDKTVKIWDAETGREVQTLDGHHTHSIYTVVFDSRGRWIASGSEDGTISLWRWKNAEARD
jgi:WD40 repeat protein